MHIEKMQRCPDTEINYYHDYMRFLPRGTVRPADKLQCSQRLPQPYSMLKSPYPSKTQSMVGTVLSFYTAPRQPGLSRD